MAHDRVEPGVGADGADALRVGVVRRSACLARTPPATGTDTQRSTGRQSAARLVPAGAGPRAKTRSWRLPPSCRPIPRIAPTARRRRRACATRFATSAGVCCPASCRSSTPRPAGSTTPPSWAAAASAFQRVVRACRRPRPGRGTSRCAGRCEGAGRWLRQARRGRGHAAAPAPAAEPAPPSPPSPPPVDYDAIFDGSQSAVVAPITVRQDLPRWSTPARRGRA